MNEKLQALIEFNEQTKEPYLKNVSGINGLLVEIDSISGGLSQTANKNPSPAGRLITSTTRMENDTVNYGFRQTWCEACNDCHLLSAQVCFIRHKDSKRTVFRYAL